LPAVAGYELLEELGRGGMGVVYKARHTRLDRFVAVKILPAEASREPAFAERFIREARALARLNHPSILTLYEFGQEAGRSYVMEYVEGTDLRQRMCVGPLATREALGIVTQVCGALQYAHDEGIVHQDIKPENILLDKRGRVRVADFGIAKLLTRKTGEYTLTGPWQVMGTLHYMAPEQIENPQGLDQRADIYSLGVMLYELFTGKLPLGRFPSPSQAAAVDARLDEVVLRALEPDPARRYQTAGEMRAALQGFAGQDSSGAPAQAAAAAPTAESTTPVLGDSPGSELVRSARERLWRPALVLLFAGMLNTLGVLIPGITYGIGIFIIGSCLADALGDGGRG
jgi:serine/threonine protein kinase